jgi:osomolarity two-component system, sensor histidine kinase NIK1
MLVLDQHSISKVTKAVAAGDLSKVMNVNVQSEMLDLKTTVDSMVAQLNTLANEVIRVNLQVGTEGISGRRTCLMCEGCGR